MNRSRKIYSFLIFITIIFGLLSRSKFIPDDLYLYLGDYLYTIMYFFIFGFLFPEKDSWKIAVYSILFCYLIEASQFIQASWINHIRSYKIGGLILGYGFLWSDMMCYTLGGLTGYLLEIFFYRKYRSTDF